MTLGNGKQNNRHTKGNHHDSTLPSYTDEGQFRVEADASEEAVGAVISQQIEGKWHPVAFHSKVLSPTK